MTNHIIAALGAMAAISASAGVSQIAQATVAQQDPLSGWISTGTLVGFGGGVLAWLVARLKKSDEREEHRTAKHEEIITKMTESATATRMVIEQNSKMLEKVNDTIVMCQGNQYPRKLKIKEPEEIA